jgi:hypothetical protein
VKILSFCAIEPVDRLYTRLAAAVADVAVLSGPLVYDVRADLEFPPRVWLLLLDSSGSSSIRFFISDS